MKKHEIFFTGGLAFFFFFHESAFCIMSQSEKKRFVFVLILVAECLLPLGTY